MAMRHAITHAGTRGCDRDMVLYVCARKRNVWRYVYARSSVRPQPQKKQQHDTRYTKHKVGTGSTTRNYSFTDLRLGCAMYY